MKDLSRSAASAAASASIRRSPLHRTHLCLVVFVLLGAVLAWASITGSISGVVTDPSGAVVSGATVVATNTQTGIRNAKF